MKKLLYIVGFGAICTFASCHSNSDYDAYVDMLKSQTATIDTISSAASYANYIEQLFTAAQDFQSKGLKLNDAQTEELQTLGSEIQSALEAKYNELAQTPMILPDDVLVEDADSLQATPVL